MINYVSSGKAMTVSLIAELIKKRDNIKWTRVIIKKKKNWVRFAQLCSKIWRKKATVVDTSKSARKC